MTHPTGTERQSETLGEHLDRLEREVDSVMSRHPRWSPFHWSARRQKARLLALRHRGVVELERQMRESGDR